jgi:haloacetate dehalogenase
MMTGMVEGFTLERIDVAEAELRVRHGGSGPPLVLLHGHPRTHVTWHRVAPLLAREFTVVCPDLRGYGESSKPPSTEDHKPYSKRAMARDVVALMRPLGHERFAVAGHDRGSYVAFRTAMDHPDAVTALAVLDSIPIGEALARADARFASAWWHWSSSARPPSRPRTSSAAIPTPGTRRPPTSWGRRRSRTTAERSTTRRPSTP